mgnify:CR=1 FL=1
MSRKMVSFNEPLYGEVYGFLLNEASLLDNNQFRTWFETCINEDIVYTMPVRTTRNPGKQAHYSDKMFFFNETYPTLELRVKKMETEYDWAEDPSSRTRRMVTNVRVWEMDDGNLEVRSYMQLSRSRLDEVGYQFLMMERVDILVRTDTGLRLRKREILVDSTIIGMKNLAIFL